MAASSSRSTLTIDLAGALLTAALLALGGWCGWVRPSPALGELTRAQSDIEQKRKDQIALDHESASFHDRLRKREAELAEVGAPPEHLPIEEDLKTITELLRRNGLNVAEVGPLGVTDYPGVRESRYRLRVEGPCADLARGLRAFEACRFWGDVTHLQIGNPAGVTTSASGSQQAELILSFYSAVETDKPTDQGP